MGVSPITIPEAIAGHISVPVPSSNLMWRMLLSATYMSNSMNSLTYSSGGYALWYSVSSYRLCPNSRELMQLRLRRQQRKRQ